MLSEALTGTNYAMFFSQKVFFSTKTHNAAVTASMMSLSIQAAQKKKNIQHSDK